MKQIRTHAVPHIGECCPTGPPSLKLEGHFLCGCPDDPHVFLSTSRKLICPGNFLPKVNPWLEASRAFLLSAGIFMCQWSLTLMGELLKIDEQGQIFKCHFSHLLLCLVLSAKRLSEVYRRGLCVSLCVSSRIPFIALITP